MKRSRKLIVALIVIVPVLAMLVAAGFFFAEQYYEVVENADELLVQELERRFDREVRVGEARVTPLGTVILDDFAIAAGRTFEEGTFISAPEIHVKYNVRELLRGGGVGSVESVKLIDPRILLIRRPDGTFNIADFIEPVEEPPGPPFEGRIFIRNGNIIFRDYLARVAEPPAVIRFNDVDALLNAERYPRYTYSISAEGIAGQFRTLRVIGRYNAETRRVAMDINAENVAAQYVAGYLGFRDGLEVTSGRVDVAAGLEIVRTDDDIDIDLSGIAQIANGVIRVPQVRQPFRDITGRIALRDDAVVADLSALIAGSRVRVRGAVSNFDDPRLNIEAVAPNLDYAQLLRTVELPAGIQGLQAAGRGGARVRITGPAGNPVVEALAQIPRLSFQGYTARNVQVSAAYRADRLDIRSARLDALGGDIVLRGTVGLDGVPRLSIQGQARGVNLAQLPIPTDYPFTGNLSADFSLTGTTGDLIIAANVVARQGRVGDIPFDVVAANVRYADDVLNIGNLRATGLAGGLVVAQGQISPERLNLNVTAQDVNLASIGDLIGRPDLAGTGYFQGRVFGSINNPLITGTLEVYDGEFAGFTANYIRVVFQGEERTIRIPEAVVRLFPGELTVAGEIEPRPEGEFAFRGRAQLQRLTVDRLMELIGQRLDIQGTLTGNLDISGIFRPGAEAPLRDVVASGNLRIEDGVAFGLPISEGAASITLANNRLTVTEAVVRSLDAVLVMSGAMVLDTGAVDATFTVSNVDLTRARRILAQVGEPGTEELPAQYVAFEGVLDARGVISGTVSNPNIFVTGDIDQIVINNQQFDSASFQLAYEDQEIQSFEGDLIDEGEVVASVSGTGYQPATNCVTALNVELSDVEVANLWDMILRSPYFEAEDAEDALANLQELPDITGGLLDANLLISGCLANPDAALEMVATNVDVGDQEIDRITVNASAEEGVIYLDELRAESGNTLVLAEGEPLLRNGQINLDVIARNLDASRLSQFLGGVQIGGDVFVELVVTGDVASPYIRGSVEVRDPSYRGIDLDAFRISQFEVTEDRIEVADVILSAGQQQITAEGYLPWSWETYSIPPDEPLEFIARLREQELSALAALIPVFVEERTSGILQGRLAVSGSLAAPVLDGALTVEDGTLGIEGFDFDFTDMNIDLAFDGNTVIVRQFSAASSLGGEFAVVPGGTIRLGPGEDNIDLLVYADNLVLAESDVFGYQEEIVLELDAGLSVTGNLASPLISDAQVGEVPAGVTISNTNLSFVVPETLPEQIVREYGINPRFDVSILLGEDVVVAPPSMTLVVTGVGDLMGTLADPDIDLVLTIQDGSIRLAGTRLQVIEGGTITLALEPDEAASIRVNFDATTSVTATTPIGQRERYLITVSVRGPVDDLQIDLSSSPPGLTQEQMLAVLGHVPGIFTPGETELQQELANILTAVGSTTLFAPIESLFVEQFGFEQFTLEFGPSAPIALYASRQLLGNFYVSYYHRLSADFAAVDAVDWELQLSYRVRPIYEISYTVDNNSIQTIQVGITRSF